MATTKIKQSYYTPLSILTSGVMISLAIYFSLNPTGLTGLDKRSGLASSKDPQVPLPTSSESKIQVTPEDDPVLGDAKAKVTMIEFTDFQCPFCLSFFKETYEALKTNFIDTGQVKFIVRDFPISQHQNAQKASETTECSRDQNKYWAMHDRLFESQREWTALSTTDGVNYFKKLAGDLGLSRSAFDICLDNSAKAQEVTKDLSDGNKAGVDGTPGFFLTKDNPDDPKAKWIYIRGAQPFSTFQTKINELLK